MAFASLAEDDRRHRQQKEALRSAERDFYYCADRVFLAVRAERPAQEVRALLDEQRQAMNRALTIRQGLTAAA